MRFFKLAVASLFAVLALGAAVQSAQAYDLSISPAGGVALSGILTFSDGGGVIRLTCPTTLSGSLDAGPVAAAAGSQLGAITSVRIGTCTGGTSVVLIGSGWPIVINTVLGTLPNAATGMLVDIQDFSWQLSFTVLGIPVACLFRGTAGGLFGLSGTTPYVTTGSFTVLGNTIPLASGAGACPRSGRFNGTLSGFTPAQTVTVS